jgi:heterodisulfide reductase subunit A-like polyferredoxin
MAFIENTLRVFILSPLTFLYSLLQWILDKLLSPTPPPPGSNLHSPRIAVIGAGLTGVSAASHCIGHGCDTTIFEAGDKNSVGGIWTVSACSTTC